jgi:hypothetical protein
MRIKLSLSEIEEIVRIHLNGVKGIKVKGESVQILRTEGEYEDTTKTVEALEWEIDEA